MGSIKLKDDLSNCLINFDRRVLITELLEDYKLAYEEVDKILQNYLVDQEKKDKIKFDKRYLIHGLQNGELKKEIYQIVEETKLEEWLQKLQNAQLCLYSVEVAGGAKAAPPIFKPMKVEECEKAKTRQAKKNSVANSVVETSTTSGNKTEVKQENRLNSVKKESPPNPPKSTAETVVKKSSPKTDTSPTDKKAADKKSTVKKGINNFFAPSTASCKKPEDNKESTKTATGNIKPTTPKKMQDFFKKQAEKPKATTTGNVKNPPANTSIQLFEEAEEEPEEISSDEEEKLEALKRDIISSDVEMEDEDENNATASAKRRRILDSDDEEDPPVKQEKLDIKKEIKEEKAVEETYLDEDGFVITKKPKQKSTTTKNKSPSGKKVPPVTIKSSPSETKKSSTSLSKDTKAATNLTAKTKQAGIKNFFSKK